MRGLILASGLVVVLIIALMVSRSNRKSQLAAQQKKAAQGNAMAELRNPMKIGDTPTISRSRQQIIIKPQPNRPMVSIEKLTLIDCKHERLKPRPVLFTVESEFLVAAEDIVTGEDYTKLIPNCRIKGSPEANFRTATNLSPGRPRQ